MMSAGEITEDAKQSVIDYGIEEALSGPHSESLSEAWDTCEAQAADSEPEYSEEQDVGDYGESSTSTITIDIERDPAPTFTLENSYNYFSDSLEAAFKDAVDTEFDPIIEKAGISVAVYSDGILWKYAKGLANASTEMRVSTPIEIKSSSKTFVSAIILDQIENGLYRSLPNSLAKSRCIDPRHNGDPT